MRAHGGTPPPGTLDFSAPLNPLGPPAWAIDAALRGVRAATSYPDSSYAAVRASLSIIAGAGDLRGLVPLNGASEALPLLLAVLRPRRLVVVEPTFGDHALQAPVLGVEYMPVVMGGIGECRPRLPFDALASAAEAGSVVLLSNPNNPTGLLVERRLIEKLSAEAGDSVIVVVDEAFIRLSAAPGESLLPDPPPNVVVVGSLTKDLALPGVRLGYLAAPRWLAARLEAARPAWNLNTSAVEVAVEAARRIDEYLEYLAEARRLALSEARRVASRLPSWVEACPTSAPFLLLRHRSRRHPELAQALARLGVYVRDASSFRGLGPEYSRVSVKRRGENDVMLAALRAVGGPDGVQGPTGVPHRTTGGPGEY